MNALESLKDYFRFWENLRQWCGKNEFEGENPEYYDQTVACDTMCRVWRERKEVLDLSKCSLKNLPPELGQLTFLRKIIAACNKLQELPLSLGELTQLRILDISANQFALNHLLQLAEVLPRGCRVDVRDNVPKLTEDELLQLTNRTQTVRRETDNKKGPTFLPFRESEF